MIRIALGMFAASTILVAQPSREMNDLNWMEFRELVPAKIETVLLKVDGVESAEVSFTASRVNVAVADETDVTILIDRIHRLGYRVLESKKA